MSVVGIRAEVIDIPVTTSEFTPMITRVRIGQPSQSLLMSLSFDSKNSFLYPRDMCQQFVTCFDSKSSITYNWVGETGNVDFRNFISGPLVTDEVSFGDEAPIEDQFVSVSNLPQIQMTARDTAGQLSLGPSGPIFSDAVLEVKVDHPVLPHGSKDRLLVPQWSLRMYLGEEVPSRAGCVTETFRVRAGRVSWQTPAQILTDDFVILNHTQVVFAPNLDDIVIPKSYQQLFNDEILKEEHGYLTAPDGRLYAECGNPDPLNPLRIKTISARSKFITILPQHLLYYGKRRSDSVKARDGIRYCPTRLVFQAGMFPIKLGLPFFASVESVVFDQPNSEVRVSFVQNRLQRTDTRLISSVPASSILSPAHIVEYYSLPVVRENVDGGLEIEFASGWVSSSRPPYTLILSSVSATMTDIDGQITSEFVFVKKFKSVSGRLGSMMVQQTPIMEFPGLYHMNVRRGIFGGPSRDQSTVTFGFEKAKDPESQTFRLELVDNPYSIVIRLRKVNTIVELHNYDLQEASEYPGNVSAAACGDSAKSEEQDGETSCRICMEEFVEGDMVQSLAPHCAHNYHVECIRSWLATNRVCCLCRTTVPFRAGVDSVVSEATNEVAESDSSDESDEA